MRNGSALIPLLIILCGCAGDETGAAGDIAAAAGDAGARLAGRSVPDPVPHPSPLSTPTGERGDQLAAALIRDVSAFRGASAQYAAAVRDGLADFRTATAAGRRPVPYVLRVPGAEGAPVEVWVAAMQSGAGEVLAPELVLELAALYHEIEGASPKYLRYAEFTERSVWPVEAGDTAGFYDPRSGRFRPEFAAHMRQLEEIVSDLERTHGLAQHALENLLRHYPGLAADTVTG